MKTTANLVMQDLFSEYSCRPVTPHITPFCLNFPPPPLALFSKSNFKGLDLTFSPWETEKVLKQEYLASHTIKTKTITALFNKTSHNLKMVEAAYFVKVLIAYFVVPRGIILLIQRNTY